MHFFSKFSSDFVDWNVEKNQKGKNLLSSRHFQEFTVVFKVKISQINTGKDRKPKFLNFQSFYTFFVKILTDFEDWNVLRGQRR